MKLTFVPKQDILEIGAIFACLFIIYIAIRDEPLVLIALIPLGCIPAYFYIRKCKARWCEKCGLIMKYTPKPTLGGKSVIYRCSICGTEKDAGILEGYGDA